MFGTPTLVRVFLRQRYKRYPPPNPTQTRSHLVAQNYVQPYAKAAGGRNREARTVSHTCCRVVGPCIGYFVGPHLCLELRALVP